MLASSYFSSDVSPLQIIISYFALSINMKLSYIFSLLPLVAAHDGYLYDSPTEANRHHLRRALTGEGSQLNPNGCVPGISAFKNAGCVACPCSGTCPTTCMHGCREKFVCTSNCGICAAAPIGYYCWKCASSAASNDYNEVMDAGDGWEDEPLDGSILEEE
jgi:hypothetical protein